jgi:hypothetical protein
MNEITIVTIDELDDSTLEAIGVEEGCSTSSTCSSLDIADVEFE